MFAAQALARDLVAAGRDDEVEQIRRDTSAVVPELPGESKKTQPDPLPHSDPAEEDG